MLMIFWVVTPLQSAIFNTGTVSRELVVNMTTISELLPLALQTTALNANFMNMAYGISWLDQRLPPYTTSELALLPFQPLLMDTNVQAAETWSTTANVFYTNLTCSAAKVLLNPNFSYTFSNGRGCTVPEIVLGNPLDTFNYMVNYIGYYDNPHSDWALDNPNCSSEFSNNFLALWASASSHVGNGVYSNLTAVFCETSYTAKEMYVTVNASTHQVQQAAPTGGNSTVPNLSDIFNITNFEYLLATGVPSTTQRSNWDESEILQQFSRIKDYSITWPVSNVVGFAVGLGSNPIEDLADPAILQRTFEKAHRVLFSAAFSTLSGTQVGDGSQRARKGVRKYFPAAIILVRPISIAVETALGVVIMFTLCLWYVSHRRPSGLTRDPATIADVMSLTSSSQGLLEVIHDDGTLTSDKLALVLSLKKYRLGKGRDGSPGVLSISLQHGDIDLSTSIQSRIISSEEKKPFVALRPTELTLSFGVTFIMIIALAIAGVIFLSVWTTDNNGW